LKRKSNFRVLCGSCFISTFFPSAALIIENWLHLISNANLLIDRQFIFEKKCLSVWLLIKLIYSIDF
jgi:hypothetical protein